ncbi:Protein of unknown function [Gryllus bimaculatus]|nr:Protein of unknown function [Gryllus bimaculatus]
MGKGEVFGKLYQKGIRFVADPSAAFTVTCPSTSAAPAPALEDRIRSGSFTDTAMNAYKNVVGGYFDEFNSFAKIVKV